MLAPRRSGAFKRDVRKAEKRGKDLAKLRTILALLIDGKPLPERCMGILVGLTACTGNR